MKRIGILGGLSAESTADFYRAVTRTYIARFGIPNYPEMVIFSVQFQAMMDWANAGQWDRFTDGLVAGIEVLTRAGADFVVIAANMPHKVFDAVAQRSAIPLLHIADAIAERARTRGYRHVALLGTRVTMNSSFYPDRLQRYNIACLVPDIDSQTVIQEIIERELVRGVVTKTAEAQYVSIIEALKARGAEAVILGCTEIPLLISNDNSPLPVMDSTQLFAERTLSAALTEENIL